MADRHWYCRACGNYLFKTYPEDPLPEAAEMYCTRHRPHGGRLPNTSPTESHSARAPHIDRARLQAAAEKRLMAAVSGDIYKPLRPVAAPPVRPRSSSMNTEVKRSKPAAKEPKYDNGVKRRVTWEAKDGTVHPTYAAATKHNTDMELQTWLDKWFDEHHAHDVYVAVDFVALAAALRAEWTVCRKAAPKASKEAA